MTRDERDALPGLTRKEMVTALDDAEFRAVCRGLNTRVLLECAGIGLVIAVQDGIAKLEPAGTSDISIVAADGVWRAVLAAVPPPNHQSFTALQLVNPEVSVSGDPLIIAQARAALERLLEVLRGSTSHSATTPLTKDLRRIAGRYETLQAPDGDYDIYVEEAGTGIPVVLLHTAGADGRQFQAQLADPAFHDVRLIAFDCPFHGRSMPPLNWDGGAYALSQARYLGWVTSFIEQHAGGRAILVGCSMGAAMAIVTAAARPDLLRGVIALEPPLRSSGRRNPYLAHAAVAGGVHNAAYVRGLMSPTSPEAMRRRAGWIYSQGAPGIYTGDLAFYSDEFDGAEVGPRIAGCPVHLLCGEYDYSATPADGLALSHLIAGSTYVSMPGLGHFPMTEDPDHFRPYFLRALEALTST